MKKYISVFVFVLIISVSLSFSVEARKKDKAPKNKNTAQTSEVQKRINGLKTEDQRLFDALSREQKDKILKGQIEHGFNEWMVKLALGEPYYATEHHPIFVDYEQVWLYTKPEIIEDRKEEKILDPVNNNWPTIHRTIKKKSCVIGDYFVLWDRGVVVNQHPTNDRKVYGSCTVETEEAYLPIVDGKPVEPKK